MDVVKLVVLILQLADKIFDWARQQGYIKEGYDKAVAEQTLAILQKTKAGKAIMERVNAMSDPDVDAALRGLEPKWLRSSDR